MTDTDAISRRKVLTSGLIATGTTLVGSPALAATANCGDELKSKVESHGHYAWFPLGEDSWGRSKSPFDIRQDSARWMAKPAGSGMRCRIENLPRQFQNAGFDVHLGALGSIKEVTVRSKTIQTNWPDNGGNAMLVGALYFDVNDDGEFFEWADDCDNTERWVSPGGDAERGLARPATDSFTIDDDTKLPVFADDPDDPPTLEEIKDGDAITGIDENTDAALYLGVASPGGESADTEELIVESLTVERA